MPVDRIHSVHREHLSDGTDITTVTDRSLIIRALEEIFHISHTLGQVLGRQATYETEQVSIRSDIAELKSGISDEHRARQESVPDILEQAEAIVERKVAETKLEAATTHAHSLEKKADKSGDRMFTIYLTLGTAVGTGLIAAFARVIEAAIRHHW